MPLSTQNPLIGCESNLGNGVLCFTTARAFNPEPGIPWEVSAEKLLALLREHFGVEDPRVAFAGQIHGSEIRAVSQVEDMAVVEKCDGLLTAERGIFLVIRTADCLPVVLVDEFAGVVGCCHAGWRGSRACITSMLIEEMVAHGANKSRIEGWIGPCISGEMYEVSEDLAADFQNAFGYLGDFLDGRYLNLSALNQLQAEEAGLDRGALRASERCTFREEDLFFSHRRQNGARGQLFTVCGFRA